MHWKLRLRVMYVIILVEFRLKIVLTFYPRESNNYPANSQCLPAKSTLDATFCKLHLKCWVNMAPPVGLEPTTHGLTVRRSTDWAKGESQCWHYLSSRQVTLQVLSTRMSLTSVFGMGTGGPSSQSIPTMWMGLTHLLYVKARCALTACGL